MGIGLTDPTLSTNKPGTQVLQEKGDCLTHLCVILTSPGDKVVKGKSSFWDGGLEVSTTRLVGLGASRSVMRQGCKDMQMRKPERNTGL